MVGGRALIALVVTAWMMIAAGPAAAEPSAAEREYRRGYQALQAGNCAKALVHYQRSLELAPRPRTLFNMATCEEELGLLADAWRRYHAFLDLAEARDAELVVEAKARISALRKKVRGKVVVESSPAGAAVSVDGERAVLGSTPLTLSLEPGPHTIRIAGHDAVAIERVVEVSPDETVAVSVELALSSEITVEVEPSDATIELDGGAPELGRLVAAVAPGRHVVSVRRDGFHPEQIVVDAVAGRSHVERVRLRERPSTAALVVAGVAGASVSVDGNAGALSMRDLPAGAHDLEVVVAGKTYWRGTVDLSAGDTVTVDLSRLDDAPSNARRTLRWGLGGLGAAAVVAGGAFGVLALRDVGSADQADHDRGKRRAMVADGLIVAGSVAIVAAWRWLRDAPRGVSITRTQELDP